MYRTDNETHSIDTRGGSLTICCESSIYSVGATYLDPCTRTNYNRAMDWIPLIIGNQSGATLPSWRGCDLQGRSGFSGLCFYTSSGDKNTLFHRSMITLFAFFVLRLFLAEHTLKGAFHIYDANVHCFPILMYK